MNQINSTTNQVVVNGLSLKKQAAKTENQPKQENVQIKEHCSSKAGKALRGMALGLMLATSALAVGKPANVQAAQNNSAQDTAVTQEATQNVAKTDVEMAVDNAMAEKSVIRVDSGKIDCEGEMTGEGRNYEVAQISEDGVLTFSDKSIDENVVLKRKFMSDGSYQLVPRVEIETNYEEKNSFNLGATVDNNEITLQVGQKYGEVAEKSGDYVMLAEDGKTINVYDSQDKCIGSCSFETADEYNTRKDGNYKALGAVAGAVGVASAITAGITHVMNKKEEEA